MPPIRVNRNVPAPALQPFTDYFQGFEKVGAVRKVFGDETEAALSRLKIGFISNRQMYMGIRDHDGNIAVGTYHLRHSEERVLYLDIVHELFHVKQWMGDKDWFTREHEKFMGDFDLYYSSPLEVPAYAHTVREAERLGMTRKEIAEYLKMMPVPPRTWNHFIKEMAINPLPRKEVKDESLPPVKINRNPRLVLHSFTEYFEGFEDSPPVREAFGGSPEKALRETKVEFLESPFGSIFPSEEDGHLVVNYGFIREADVESVYLDTVLSLIFVAAMRSGSAARAREGAGFGESPLILHSYRTMVEEARRIGVPDEKVVERLQLPRFMMGEREFAEFVRGLGIEPRKDLT